MELILASSGSYPRIGDDNGKQLLRRTIAQVEKGEKTDAELRQAEDRMTELALEEQTAAGLDVVTDGLIRWYDPISHLAGKLSGVRINGLLRFFDTNCYFRQPVVQSKLARTKPLAVDDFNFAKGRTQRTVKPVLTGPVTLARLSIVENGQSGGFERLVEEYGAALAEEIAALSAAGAEIIQVDEPALLRRLEDFELVERSLAAFAARKGKAQLALALYFGNPEPLYVDLQSLPVDVLALDFTYNPKLVDVIAANGSSKILGLGLVDGRNTKLEDAGEVARQIERMAPRLKPGRAYLQPSCGLEYLPRDRAQMKLKQLSAIKKTISGSAQ